MPLGSPHSHIPCHQHHYHNKQTVSQPLQGAPLYSHTLFFQAYPTLQFLIWAYPTEISHGLLKLNKIWQAEGGSAWSSCILGAAFSKWPPVWFLYHGNLQQQQHWASRSNLSTIFVTYPSLKNISHTLQIYIYIHIYDKPPKYEVNKFKSVSRGLPHTNSSKNPPWSKWDRNRKCLSRPQLLIS